LLFQILLVGLDRWSGSRRSSGSAGRWRGGRFGVRLGDVLRGIGSGLLFDRTFVLVGTPVAATGTALRDLLAVVVGVVVVETAESELL
jgi:hypothetical protein